MPRLDIFSPKRWLRSPGIIIGELAALTLLCSLGAAIPQQATANSTELEWLHRAGPVVTTCIEWLGLDHLFSTPLFIAVTLLCSASLLVVILEQLTRLRLQWAQNLSPAHFHSAPLQATLELPTEPGQSPAPVRTRIWTENRLGLFGSPIFHTGLLLLVLAGALRALFVSTAVVDLIEGETLAPVADAWKSQSAGPFASPFCLKTPLTLQAIQAAHYQDGDLRELTAQFALAGPPRSIALSVNHDWTQGSERLFVSSNFGPAALVEWRAPGTEPNRQSVLLQEHGAKIWVGKMQGPSGQVAHFRTKVREEGKRPFGVDVRVMKEGALLFTGEIEPGRSVLLPGGQELKLAGIPYWVRLRGSRDCALGLACASFVLILAGAILMFTVVKVDFCITVTPVPEANKNRVTIAIKPQRMAQLFQERLEQLVQEQKQAAAGLSQPLETPFQDLTGPRWLHPVASQSIPLALIAVGSLFFSGCSPSPKEQARQLVERYNQTVSEAYRRGDAELAEPVAGPKEAKKLLGLIGARLDAGLTLDSHLLSLEITQVDQAASEMRVQTRESWNYCDRKIGSGTQVGEASTDYYEMLYVFKKINETWVVDSLHFTTEPKVGRKQLTYPTTRPAHGLSANPKPENIKP